MTCGATRRRTRRGRSVQESPLNYPTSLDQSGTKNGTREQELTEKVQNWLTDMRKKGTLPEDLRDVQSRRRLLTPKPRNPLNLRSRREAGMTHTISITFTIVYTLPSTLNGADGFYKMYDLVDTLTDMAYEGDLRLSVPGVEINPMPDVIYEEPEADCPHGFGVSLKFSCGRFKFTLSYLKEIYSFFY